MLSVDMICDSSHDEAQGISDSSRDEAQGMWLNMDRPDQVPKYIEDGHYGGKGSNPIRPR